MSKSENILKEINDLGCYETNLNIGRELYYAEKNYLDARQVFENTKLCSDKPPINELDKLIDEINEYFKNSEQTPYRLKNKWGVVTEEFIYSIKPNWDETRKLSDEFFKVSIRIGNNKYEDGVINKQGIEIIPLAYQSIKFIGKELFQITTFEPIKKTRLLLSNGSDVTPIDFSHISTDENLKEASIRKYGNKNKYFGIINLSGDVIIEAIYEEITPFSEYYRVKSSSNKLYGVIKKSGVIVISLIYKNISLYDKYIILENENFSLLDSNLNLIIQDNKNEIFYLTDSFLSVLDYSSGKYGIIDRFGNKLFDFIFDSVSNEETENFWIRIFINNKCGAINNEGKLIIPPIYEIVVGSVVKTNSNSQIYYWVLLNGKIGIHNNKGDLIIARIYDGIRGAYYDYSKNHTIFIVSINHRFGVIDDKGNIVIDFKYEWIERKLNYIDGLFHYAKDSSQDPYQYYGLMTYDGIEYTEPLYRRLIDKNSSLIFFRYKNTNRRGMLDNFGRILNNFYLFELSTLEKYDLYAVSKNGYENWGIVDYNLTLVIPFKYKDPTYITVKFDKIYVGGDIYSLDGKNKYFQN